MEYLLKKFYCLLLAIWVLGCIAKGWPKTYSKHVRIKKLIGGYETEPGQHPWMVSIHKRDCDKGPRHVCGGTILNKHWILTAAHCFKFPKNFWKYNVYIGVHSQARKDFKPSKKYEISNLIVHENYDGLKETYPNDMALLRTEEPIEFKNFGGFVKPVPLPDSDKDPTGHAIVIGWGRTDRGSRADILQAVDVPIVPRYECSAQYKKYTMTYITEKQICAGTAAKDAREYDSGGPLLQKNENGGYTLIGIVSYGRHNKDPRLPGVYTKVSFYTGWLKRNMENPGITTGKENDIRFSKYCKTNDGSPWLAQDYPKY